MRLTELEPRFIRYIDRVEPREFAVGDPLTWRARGCPSERRVVTVHYTHRVEALAEAQGIEFLCPVCFAKNRGAVGTHWCEVSFEGRGVKPAQGSHTDKGLPSRWTVSGTSLANLTLMPSIKLEGGCAWHGYITNGGIS
jgi:hypothetical protein